MKINITCFIKVKHIIKNITLAIFLLILILPLIGQEPGNNTESKWFALFLNGKKSGHMKTTRTIKNNQVTTISIMYMELNRGSSVFKYSSIVENVETIDGKPVSFRKKTSSSGMIVTINGSIGSDGMIKIIIDTNGRKTEKILPFPKSALMPEGIRLIEIKNGLKKGTKYSIRQFSTDTLSPLDIDITIGGTSKVDLLGRVVPLIEIEQNVDYMGTRISAKSYTTDNHEAQKLILPMMGMEMVQYRCRVTRF